MSGTPELPLRAKIGAGFTQGQVRCYWGGPPREAKTTSARMIVCDECGDKWTACSRHPGQSPEWVKKGQLCRCWVERFWDTIPESCSCGHVHPFDPATVTDEFLVRVGILVEVVPVPE